MNDSSKSVVILHRAGGLPVPISRLPAPAGLNIEELALKYHGSLDGIQAWERSESGLEKWHPISRDRWKVYRPISDEAVMFTHRLHGGGDNDVFAIIASIALAVVAPYLAGTVLGLTGLTATAVAAGITVGGSLLLAKLFPPDAPSISSLSSGDAESKSFSDVSTDSNLLGKEAYPPIAVGRVRVSPPDIVHPRSYLEDGVQVLERLLALDGPHGLSDLQADRTPILSDASFTVNMRDGHEYTGTSTFVNSISVPVNIGEQLSSFTLSGTELADQETPSESEPRWVVFSTPDHEDLSEINIRLRLDAFYESTVATQEIRVPLRMQFRLKGADTWISFPEIHFVGRTTSTKLLEIRIRWDSIFGDASSGGEIDYEFWQKVPAVTSHALSDGSENAVQWQADSHFVIGPDNLQATKNIIALKDSIRIDLLESLFPKGALEFRVQRGLACDDDGIDANYNDGTDVVSLFVARNVDNKWQAPFDQGSYTAGINVIQATAIAKTEPAQWPETTLIAIKSKGQSFKNVSVEAGRYIDDYNDGRFVMEFDMSSPTAGGSDWTDNTITGLKIDASGVLADGNFIYDFVEVLDAYGNVGYRDGFEDGVGDWTATNGTLAASANETVTLTPSGANPYISNSSISFVGGTYFKVRIGVKKVDSGQCATWDGTLEYSTSGHGFSSSYYGQLAEPADWDALGWTYRTAYSKNPAGHYRYLQREYLIHNNTNTAIMVDADYVGWWTECKNQGYECNGVFAGESILEAFSALATAGFARPRFSDGFGIDYFRDRSGELPVQTFSERNTDRIDFEFVKESLPSEYRGKFKNEEDSFKDDERIVPNTVVSVFKGPEAVSFKAISKPLLVDRRLNFDSLQDSLRQRKWMVETSIEGVVAEIGDLCCVLTDLFDDKSHGARIRSVLNSTHISIDQNIPKSGVPASFGSSPAPAVADIFSIGESSLIFIHTQDGGTIQRTIIEVEGDVIRLDEPLPFSASIPLTTLIGSHVGITSTANASHRCFIVGIDRRDEEMATVTLVDEEPRIYEMLQETYG